MGISKTRIKRLRERLLGKERGTLTIIEPPPRPTKVDHLTAEEIDELKKDGRYWDHWGEDRGHWVWPKKKTYTPEEKAERERQIRLGQLLVIPGDDGLPLYTQSYFGSSARDSIANEENSD